LGRAPGRSSVAPTATGERRHTGEEEEMFRYKQFAVSVFIGFVSCTIADAATMTFFNSDQVAILVTEGPTWDKIQSSGYYFTYTRDKFFTKK
jgi:hypothetical protein